jgi:predicted RNase H-like HicB family nuclease
MIAAMKRIIQVHITKGDEYFVAECIDLPVVTQGKTLDELADNLREAISLQLEGENPADFGLVDAPSILASFEVEPLAHAET